MAYENGKSAVRLSQGVIPRGPHLFRVSKATLLGPHDL